MPHGLCRQSWLIFLLPRTRLFILDCWSSCLRKSVPEIWLSVPAPLSDAPMREIDGSHFSLLRFPAAQYRAVSALSIGQVSTTSSFSIVRTAFILQFSYSPRHGGAICHAVMSCFTCFPPAPDLRSCGRLIVDCAFPRFGPINRLSICNEHFRQMYCRILLFFVVRSPWPHSRPQRTIFYHTPFLRCSFCHPFAAVGRRGEK